MVIDSQNEYEVAKIEQQKFIRELFNDLEDAGIDYAILRNYENYPNFEGDVDIVINPSDIKKYQEIAVRVVEKLEWNFAISKYTEAHNLPHTYVNDHIFCKLNPLTFAQIGICNGFHLIGLPILTSEELLKNKVKDRTRNFTHINKLEEGFYYLFRLSRILFFMQSRSYKKVATQKWKSYCHSKLRSYRKKTLKYYKTNSNKFRKLVDRIFSPISYLALTNLEKKQLRQFYFYMILGHLYFLVCNVTQAPFQSIISLTKRLVNLKHSHSNKLQETIFYIYKPTNSGKQLLFNIMKVFEKYKFIAYLWTENNANSNTLNLYEKYHLRWRCWVFKWIKNENEITPFILIEQNDNEKTLINKLLDYYIYKSKYTVLFPTNYKTCYR